MCIKSIYNINIKVININILSIFTFIKHYGCTKVIPVFNSKISSSYYI